MNTKNYKKNNSMKTVPPKKKTIDKNQLLAYLLAVLIIFWTVASIFGMIAFGRTTKKSSNVVSASAQTVEDFVDNERLIITNPIKNFVVYDYASVNTGAPAEFVSTLFGYDFYFGENGLGLFDGTENNFYENPTQDIYYSYLSSQYGTIETEQFTVTSSTRDIADFYEQWTSIDYYIIAQSVVRNGARHFVFSHRFEFNDSVQGYTQIANFSFDYTMSMYTSDTSLVVIFPNAQGGASHEWILEYGDYESSPSVEGFDTTDFLLYYYSVDTGNFDIAYGNGYDNGYEKGRSDARADTYDKGYREGREFGRQEGYDEGFLAGVNDANEYSFDGLISAVFDVPVRTFFSFFQFEILGVDLSSFFLSLFAIAVFLAVVRFIF